MKRSSKHHREKGMRPAHTVFAVGYENCAQKFVQPGMPQPYGVEVYVFFNPREVES